MAVGKILVLDNDELMRDAMRRILDHRGHTVLTAATPADAVRLAATGDVAIVVADVTAAGPGLAARLGPRVGVVFVSGLSRAAAESRDLIPPGATFIGKPFTTAQPRATVDAVLGAGGRLRDRPTASDRPEASH